MTQRNQLIENLLSSLNTIRRKIMCENTHSFGQFGLTPAQVHLLFFVKKNEGVGVKEIANSLKMTSSAITQLVETLVQNEYLIRENSNSDRRALKIYLSNKSKELASSLRRKSLGQLDYLFEALDEKELEDYCKLTEKIVLRIKTEGLK